MVFYEKVFPFQNLTVEAEHLFLDIPDLIRHDIEEETITPYNVLLPESVSLLGKVVHTLKIALVHTEGESIQGIELGYTNFSI